MTAEDLTRLRAVAIEAAKYKRGDRSMLAGEAFSAWANQVTPPTVAALIDRVERAERERDRLQTEVNTWIENDQISFARATRLDDEITALRAAVAGLADEWEAEAQRFLDAPKQNIGQEQHAEDLAENYRFFASPLRALLTEGADDGQ